MILSAERVGWTVRGLPIVEDVTLAIREGETFGLIGPNGSGKSTLMKLLAGLLAPSGGHVTLSGQRLETMRRRDVARQMAFVEQQSETYERLTVRDAVELGRTAWLSAIEPWSAADDAIVAAALADVDMGGKENRLWHTLSGGERQRVHIARALAQRPRLLLLDEPTNHLDIHHQLAILDLVKALPVTAVIALHDLNQAMVCDRLGLMRGGKLVSIGRPEEVLTAETLRNVFGVRASFMADAEGASFIRFHGVR